MRPSQSEHDSKNLLPPQSYSRLSHLLYLPYATSLAWLWGSWREKRATGGGGLVNHRAQRYVTALVRECVTAGRPTSVVIAVTVAFCRRMLVVCSR